MTSDKSGDKLLKSLPHYIKEESIGFGSRPEARKDYINNFLDKYCQSRDVPAVRKDIKKNFILGKFKIKPESSAIPRAKKTQLSLREKRQLGLYKISRSGLKYQEFLQLHELWRQYMLDSLDFPHLTNEKGEVDCSNKHWEQLSSQLYKADFHGALLTVIRSKCPSQVGHQGIVVMDTKNTFKILGTDNVVRSIPKDTSVFQFQVDQFKFTVYGKHLCIRPAERSTKKIRNNLFKDL